MAQSLRETMPITAGFIDACREVFGVSETNAAIRAGMEGQETFYAAENGRTVGTKSTGMGVSLSDLQIGPCEPIAHAGGRK